MHSDLKFSEPDFFDDMFKKLEFMEGTRRADVKPGIDVRVEFTEGKVKEVLTSSTNHPHGIKVMLENGLVGRIKQII